MIAPRTRCGDRYVLDFGAESSPEPSALAELLAQLGEPFGGLEHPASCQVARPPPRDHRRAHRDGATSIFGYTVFRGPDAAA